jgi:hypothetical protein
MSFYKQKLDVELGCSSFLLLLSLRASSEAVFIMLHLWPGLLLSIDFLASFHSQVMGYWYLDHGSIFPSGLLFFQVTLIFGVIT